MGTVTMLHRELVEEVREVQTLDLVLNAIISPGKVSTLPMEKLEVPAPWPTAIAQIAKAFLHGQATFAVQGEKGESLSRYLTQVTGCQAVPLHLADYVVAGHPIDWLDIWAISGNSRLPSRRRTTLLLASRVVAELDSDGRSRITSMTFRGTRQARAVAVDDDAFRLLQQLADREDEHPIGIDIILVDSADHFAALPRNTWWLANGIVWVS